MAARGSSEDGAAHWLSGGDGGDDKKVVVWRDAGGTWERFRALGHGKKVTACLFDSDGRAVFADRFGDVYRWLWAEGGPGEAADAAAAPEEDDEDAEGGSSEAQLLLSHLAIVTAMAFTESGRFLVTADNHEKIRVSCYPQAAEIYSFCLGHLGQITALACLGEEAVVSTSSDGTLRLWGLDGEERLSVDLGAPVSSLCCGAGEAVVGCEAGPGLRRVLLAGGASDPPKVEALAATSAPGGLVAPGGLPGVLWVDRAGHLRTGPAAEDPEGAWAGVFEGEDLPEALAKLSKNADYEGEEADE
eukprot:CAMPEP_0168431210 /NCGR_PEP_ID=MMETSP0228-20121227/38266_1 /TAXON_ID=133427 /ORGANISM="Protoceratium reticulatum, Strain CCCM 535 (=CCMP 1889)" /LENGTH=301 /DNA_ID=CAMNT_0008445315 /DNA_START=62 /DNA_END=965 /DNA_ORIENTATION=-